MRNEGKIALRGVMQIDAADWQMDETNTLNLYVRDAHGKIVHCWMTLRPAYCDRGHIQLNIDGVEIGLDGADRFPRYFFSFEEANHHARTFLKWRLWKHRVYEHGWGDLNKNEVRDYNPSVRTSEQDAPAKQRSV